MHTKAIAFMPALPRELCAFVNRAKYEGPNTTVKLHVYPDGAGSALLWCQPLRVPTSVVLLVPQRLFLETVENIGAIPPQAFMTPTDWQERLESITGEEFADALGAAAIGAPELICLPS